MVKEEYQLDGQTAAVNRFYSDGVVQKTYIVKGIAFITNPDTQRVRALMLNEGVGRDLRFGASYPGFEWLKTDFFVDAPEQGGRKLAHYRQAPTKGKGGTTFDPYATETEREAWIDEDNHLPFAFREGKVSGVYQFEAVSPEKIPLPSEIEQAIRKYNGYR
ncbi:MAG: hypothetical protein INR62_01420 [Rhodospirillales bacterium]|nr:hypothetical protein [Acetobacter sp.]